MSAAPDKSTTVTAYIDAETDRLLDRLASQEFRSRSSTIALLIRKEAAARGMLARAPELVPHGRTSRS